MTSSLNLAADPLQQAQKWALAGLCRGHQVSVYTYAANNPVRLTDPTCRFVPYCERNRAECERNADELLYFDEESDLHENWNRFYEPLTARYLSPEPLLQNPQWVKSELGLGHHVAAYAYARSNPVTSADVTGLFTIDQRSFRAAGAGARWNYVYDLGMDMARRPVCRQHFASKFGGYDVVANFSMSGGPKLVFDPGGTQASVARYSNGTVHIDADKFRRDPAYEVVRRLIHELAHDAYERRPKASACEPDLNFNDEEEQAREAEEVCLGPRLREYLP